MTDGRYILICVVAVPAVLLAFAAVTGFTMPKKSESTRECVVASGSGACDLYRYRDGSRVCYYQPDGWSPHLECVQDR